MMVLSFFSSWLSGFAVACFLWSDPKTSWTSFFLKALLGAGLGMGISSCVYFISVLFLPNFSAAVFIGDALIAIALTGLLWLHNRRISFPPSQTGLQKENLSLPIFFSGLIFLIAGLVSISAFWKLSHANPYGEWDAISIWNPSAQFLYRGSHEWAAIFKIYAKAAPLDTPTDYPLLLPSLIARGWAYNGQESPFVPALIAFFFTFGCIGLMTVSLFRLRGISYGFWAGLALLGTPFFILHGASQYADIELAFFMLASFICLEIARRSPAETSKNRMRVLTGLFLGFCVWTKNEGLLFLGIFLALESISTAIKDGLPGALKKLSFLLIGALPGLGMTLCLKLSFSLSNKVVGASKDIFKNISDPSRYAEICQTLASHALSFGQWTIPLSAVFMAVLFIPQDPLKGPKKDLKPFFTVLLLFLGYFSVYLMTPLDLSWHLKTSVDRLFFHVWPVFIWAVFLHQSPQIENGDPVE